jgi:hypothetical protein
MNSLIVPTDFDKGDFFFEGIRQFLQVGTSRLIGKFSKYLPYPGQF